MNQKDVQRYLSEIGRKGGQKGGKAKTPEKLEAIKKSLAKARKKRWPKRKKTR